MRLRRRPRSEQGSKKNQPSDRELLQVLLPDGTKTKAFIIKRDPNQDNQEEEEEEEESDNDGEKRDVL